MTANPNDLLRNLLSGLKDKEAASTWGKVADEEERKQAERPSFWKRSEGPISGTVTRVYEDLNYEKTKNIPHIDIDGDDGRKWKWGITTTGFARIGAEKAIQKGDHIKQVLGKKEAGKTYYVGDDIIVTRDGVEVKSAVDEASEVPF